MSGESCNPGCHPKRLKVPHSKTFPRLAKRFVQSSCHLTTADPQASQSCCHVTLNSFRTTHSHLRDFRSTFHLTQSPLRGVQFTSRTAHTCLCTALPHLHATFFKINFTLILQCNNRFQLQFCLLFKKLKINFPISRKQL